LNAYFSSDACPICVLPGIISEPELVAIMAGNKAIEKRSIPNER